MTTPTDLVLVPREQLVQLRDMAIDHKCQPIEECLFNVLMFCASAPSPWRDIESAPRDGAPVLFYSPLGGVVLAASGEPILPSREEKLRLYQDGAGFPNAGYIPTHWMPLPTPPEDSVQKETPLTKHKSTQNI